MKKHYTLYKTTNTINGMIYIGVHLTDNPTDRYLGSGRELKEAIKKYGRSNFKKEILFIFDNVEDVFNKEKEIVDDKFRKRQDTYNCSIGGGGWGMAGVKLTKETRDKMSKARTGIKRTFTKEHCENLSKVKKGKKQAADLVKKRIAPLIGRTKEPHTDEVKKKISETKIGSIWITNFILNKTATIKPELLDKYISEGWIKGRYKV